MWQKIKKIIEKSQHIVITTHLNPDGDGIGSAAALIELLLYKNKNPVFLCDGPIPKKFAFLDIHGLHKDINESPMPDKIDTFIVLDTHSIQRVGQLASLAKKNGVTSICFDHHPLTTELFTPNAIIDSKASCVGILIDTLFHKCGIDLNLQAATGIYTSIICDTGRFSNSLTNRKAHLVADDCILHGVDPDLMYSRIYQHISLNQYKIFAQSLQHVELHLDNSVLIHPITREDCEKTGSDFEDIDKIDLEYLLELNKQVEDVECVVLLREIPGNQIRISMRSKSKLNTEKLMQQIGGGGHSKAAGAIFKGSMKEAIELIVNLLRKAFIEIEGKYVVNK